MTRPRPPRRLLDATDGLEPFDRRLLLAGKEDTPSGDHVSSAVALAMSSAGLANAASAQPPAATMPAPAAGATSIATKVMLGLLGIGAVATMAYGLSGGGPGESVAAAPGALVPVAASSAPSAAPERALTVEELPSAPATATATPPLPRTQTSASDEGRTPPNASAAAGSSTPSIAEELEMLQSARRLLREANTAGALQQLQIYRRKYPRGALSVEEATLRIDAEVAAGDVEHARVDAARFLVDHPGSPQADRIRSIQQRLGAP